MITIWIRDVTSPPIAESESSPSPRVQNSSPSSSPSLAVSSKSWISRFQFQSYNPSSTNCTTINIYVQWTATNKL